MQSPWHRHLPPALLCDTLTAWLVQSSPLIGSRALTAGLTGTGAQAGEVKKEVLMTATVGWEESYMGQLRQLAGGRKLIMPAARAVVRDSAGRILFIRRRDNGNWGMPAGAWELDETILECLKREVREETGLMVNSATPMAIYCHLDSTSAYGDPYQLLVVQFTVDDWSGTLVTQTDETVDAAFHSMDDPPEPMSSLYDGVLQDLIKYDDDGKLILERLV